MASAYPPDLNLGPLTTTFTAPKECSSVTVQATVDSSGTTTYLPYIYPRLFSSIVSSCFPSGYPVGSKAQVSTFGLYGGYDEHVYYSPGLCPSGWGQNVLETGVSETTAFCCEPGFSATSAAGILGPPSSTFCGIQIDATILTTVAYSGDGSPVKTSIFTFGRTTIPAPAVWIRYKDSDFGSSSPTTTSKPSSSTSNNARSSSSPSNAGTDSSSQTTPGSATTSPATSTTSPAEQQPSPTATGLSTGAKIGIGVGVPFAVILAGIIFAFIFIRRRKQKQNTIQEPRAELPGSAVGWKSGGNNGPAELDGVSHMQQQPISELEDLSSHLEHNRQGFGHHG